jgi:hypothetical protein
MLQFRTLSITFNLVLIELSKRTYIVIFIDYKFLIFVDYEISILYC